jgi:phosphohistidine phosphatase
MGVTKSRHQKKSMRLYLVHHADAVGPHVDTQRPLSAHGRAQADRLAAGAKAAGAAPAAIFHSGKLRARQTAEAFYRQCNPFADFKMIRGLLPDDPPQHVRDLVTGEPRDLLLVGHMPGIREILRVLVPGAVDLPLHGMVAVESDGAGSWKELWRLEAT